MDAAALFVIQQKLRAFESQCSMSTHQVAHARTLQDLARLSNHAPHADAIIRNMSEVKRASYRLELAIMNKAMALLGDELKQLEPKIQVNPQSKQALLVELMRDISLFRGHHPMVVSRGLNIIQRHPVNRIPRVSAL